MNAAGRLKMMKRAAVDSAEARKKIARAQLAEVEIGQEVAGRMGEVFVDVIEMVAPRDTNRFVRAYQMAANEAGLAFRTVLPVKPSGRRDEWIRALQAQVDYWRGQKAYYQKLLDMMDAQDRGATKKQNGRRRKRRSSSPSYRRYKREVRRAEKEEDAAFGQLREALGSEAFLLFDKGGFAEGRSARYGKRKRFRSTVRTRVYGGRGRRDSAGTMHTITFENREPHASIVARSARHGRPVEFATAAVRALGGQVLGRKHALAIAEASGLKTADHIRTA